MDKKREKVYTSQQVALHNNAKDLWMTIHGKAYNLTKFLTEHPGGEDVLLNLAGQDGTVCFDEIGHSQEALQLQENYLMGTVIDTGNSGAPTTVTNDLPNSNSDDDWQYEEASNSASPYFSTFVTIGIVVYAFIFYYLYF